MRVSSSNAKVQGWMAPVLAGAGLVLVGVASAQGAAVVFSAAGTYDPNPHSNTVDRNANGNAIGATGASDYAGFKANVASAYTSNLGGVIDFETSKITVNGVAATETNNSVGLAAANSYSVTYGASGQKSLALGFSADARTAFYASASPLSGTRFLSLGTTDTDSLQTLTISFGSITGGATGEAVTAVALSGMGRNATDYSGNNVAITANFSGGGSSSLASLIDSQIAGVNQNPADTFFGFVAPTNQSITSLTITRQRTIPFDDLGFITSVVPEPTMLGALLVPSTLR